ncbi:MAG: ATP-binding cassette domain-containing protein [Oscillospiraceae bacterium]|jgi:ABC-2 type transport system ATP-binding protein|nr:ATP-binding cassette domain-containing protein [Oscillospiraceae bacterium]
MSDTVINLSNVSKRYRRRRALDNVSLTLKRGRIYGLVGQNGAGKTTLLRILSGLSEPNAGEYSIFGDTNPANRRRLGILIEHPVFYENLSWKENLKTIDVLKGTRSDVTELGETVGFGKDDDYNTVLRSMSMGNKQRYGIAAALVGDPEVVLLDEPINGLDPLGVKDVRELILELNRKGTTFLISSHLLRELWEIATDYIFIHKGKIIERVSREELQTRIEGKDQNLENYFVDLVAGGTK